MSVQTSINAAVDGEIILRHTAAGDPVANIPIAYETAGRGGELITFRSRLVVFGPIAERVAGFTGSRISCYATPQARGWTGRDGGFRTSLEYVADEATLRRFLDSQESEPAAPVKTRARAKAKAGTKAEAEIPF